MKKTLAIALLAVGNSLLTLALGFGATLLILRFMGFGAGLSLLLLALHVTGAVLLQGVYQRRGWLSPVGYWLCSAVTAAGFSFIILGVGEGLLVLFLTFSGLIYSGAFLIALGAALCVKFRSSKPIVAIVGFAASVGTGILFIVFAEGNLFCFIPLAAVHIAAMTIAQHFLEKKRGLSAFRFWLLASVPATALTGILFLIEMLIGGGYDIFTLTLKYTLPAAVLLGAILLLRSLICRRLRHNAVNDNKEG